MISPDKLDLIPQGKVSYDPDAVVCYIDGHKRRPLGESYPSTGPNLLKKIVTCTLQNEYCGTCDRTFLTLVK